MTITYSAEGNFPGDWRMIRTTTTADGAYERTIISSGLSQEDAQAMAKRHQLGVGNVRRDPNPMTQGWRSNRI